MILKIKVWNKLITDREPQEIRRYWQEILSDLQAGRFQSLRFKKLRQFKIYSVRGACLDEKGKKTNKLTSRLFLTPVRVKNETVFMIVGETLTHDIAGFLKNPLIQAFFFRS